MPTPQRLPIVNSDDGVWGDIIRQYLMKEHFNDDTDNSDNGGHKNITIRAGTAGAGGAPLKFTTGALLTTPEAGAVEFVGDNLYVTQASGPTRKKVALYDDTSGATGDIYYRNSSGAFVRLAAGSTDDFLTIASGIPSWTASIVGKALDNTNSITVTDANLTLQDDGDATKQMKFQLSGITTSTTRTLTVPDASTTLVGTDTTQTLTNKTLTSPVINNIHDANGAVQLDFSSTASAVNYLNINNQSAGNSPGIAVLGTDTDISIGLAPKGAGGMYYFLGSGQTSAWLGADGLETDINLNLTSKGTGVVQANGVEVATVDMLDTTSTLVVTTQVGDTGTEDGADTWAKIATYSTGTDQFQECQLILSVTDSNSGYSDTAIVSVFFRSNATSSNPTVLVNILAKGGDGILIDNDSFKVISGGWSTDMELWFRKGADYGRFSFYETSRAINGGTLTYTTNPAWQSSTPTGAVNNISSDGVYAGVTGTVAGSVSTVDATQTLTNKTLTSPRINTINDTNGAPLLELAPTASAVNYVHITNRETGGAPVIGATGSDTNINLVLQPQGTGRLQIYRLVSGSAEFNASGLDANVDMNITNKGTGRLLNNGVAVPTISSTDTLTNKTISGSTNTVDVRDDSFFISRTNNSTVKVRLLPSASQSTSTTANLTLPTANGDATLVSTSGTQTLTNKTLTSPVINTSVSGSAVATAATASTLTLRDSSGNITANAYSSGFTTTATAAGTTTLTIASTGVQVFTGSTTQTVRLPTTSVVAGGRYTIINQSSGVVTVQSSGSNTITAMAASTTATFTALVATPTTAANWSSDYSSASSSTFSDTSFTVQDDGDATKQMKFQLSGITTSTTRTLTVPDASTTLVGTDTTQTLTNKRITARVTSISSSATPTFNTDTCDLLDITALATDITSMTSSMSGTPTNGQRLMIRIKGDATPRTISWGSSFTSSGVATLLATTAASKTHHVDLVYDSASAKWVCITVDATGY